MAGTLEVNAAPAESKMVVWTTTHAGVHIIPDEMYVNVPLSLLFCLPPLDCPPRTRKARLIINNVFSKRRCVDRLPQHALPSSAFDLLHFTVILCSFSFLFYSLHPFGFYLIVSVFFLTCISFGFCFISKLNYALKPITDRKNMNKMVSWYFLVNK